ncbi:hypothetical protein [Fodinicola acaciae]|uniref:hypothetical protein n=1 Tax=Fodinicola acaciae TaxID=2681555 RepID=UPI0013D04DD9|nr:hypothetical protein [Fodinicola acaciae]
MGDEYGGWFRDIPRELRPEWAQRQVEDQQHRAAFERYALRRLPQLQAAVPVRPPRRTPCMAVGILVDNSGERYVMLSISGDGAMPKGVRDLRDPRELYATTISDNLDAEQRIVRTVRQMRAINEEKKKRGEPVEMDGVRLESVAASYPICWRKCQPELRAEGTKPLTRLEPPPPDYEPPSPSGPDLRPLGPDAQPNARRSGRPKR